MGCPWRQFLVAFLGNVGVLNFGLQAGWLSPIQPQLQSNDSSPIGGPALTDEQISWVGSLPSMVSLVSTAFIGWTMERYGRKKALMLCTLPYLLCYTLLVFANDVRIVYAARLVFGFCSIGAFACGPIYVSEMVMPAWRSMLGGVTGFFVKLGIILAYAFGTYFSYVTMNLTHVSFTVVFLLFVVWMPESPVYLIKQGRRKEAEAAWVKIWTEGERSKIDAEIQMLQENSIENEPKADYFTMAKKFIGLKSFKRGSIAVGVMYAGMTFCGYPAVVRYSVDIFMESGVSYSPYAAAISIAVAQLAASLLGALVVERVGGKTQLVCSFSFMSLCMGVLSLYLHLKSSYDSIAFIAYLEYLPTAALIGFMAGYAFGFGTVPFIIVPQYFHPEMRATLSTLANIVYSFGDFIVLKFFPTLTPVIGLSGSIAIFAAVGTAGSALLYFFMVEVKGLDFNGVQRKLAGRVNDTLPGENLLTPDERRRNK